MKIIKSLMAIMLCVVLCASCTQHSENTIDNSINMNERLITISESIDSTEIAQMVSPAIVGISSGQGNSETVGSGVCVASGGYVVTNSHVISNDKNISLHLFNGNVVSAALLYKDAANDIAILKSSTSLPYLPLAKIDEISVGEDVLAVGTPISLLLKHTFTKGIVSALNRTLRVSGSSGDVYMQNLIQHDASLNSGNSGGPLLNASGEVVGINTLKINSSEGLGFAIPVKGFSSLLQSFCKDENYTTPYIGAFGYDAEIANYYQKTKDISGVYLESVDENSPLSQIGIKAGDVITAINGYEINNILDLRNVLYSLDISQEVEISYRQKGKTLAGNALLQMHPVNN